MKPLISFSFDDRPMVVAHRGSSGLAPENTMAAIRRGVEAGADMVEIDVQSTADNQVIVFHDSVLGRTTNGSGRVDRWTLDSIQKLDAGSWKGAEFAGERVPLLREAIDYLLGRAYVNIELKHREDDPSDHLLRMVLEEIAGAGMEGYTLLSSFDHRLLIKASTHNPAIPTAVILHPDDRGLPSERALSVGARAVVLSRRQLTRRVSEDARSARIPIGVYTVNDAQDVARAIDYGVSAIVTNHPEIVMAAVTGRVHDES